MGLALYRRYRPRTFAEVIGQEHVTEPLMQALRTGRLNHAYLFSGPRGCGKTSSARILARSLNCERGPTPEPCGECDSCVALAPDGSGSIDVIEIDAASHGGVDDARDLRERAIFAPVSSRFKVYVIDEAHMVSSAGFNALLKLVEEPPDYVKFVFATTEPDKVLGTIKSRTHHYPFRLITPGVLRPYLEKLCATEGVKVEPAVFPLVVRAGGGSARDTLSVLDQLIAGAGPEGVTYPRAVALLGVTDVALLDEMCDALAAGDGAAAYGTIDRVVEAGHDPRRFASDLLGRLRDLIVLQQVPDAAGKGLLDAPDDELTRMASQAQRFGPATLSRLADIVHDGLTEMRGTTAPRLLLELICARMLLPGADDSAGALLQRLERMERRLAATGEPPTPTPTSEAPQTRTAPQNQPEPQGTTAPRSKPEPPSQAEPQDDRDNGEPQAAAVAVKTAAPERPGVLDAVAVRRVWEEILGYVGRKSRRVGAVAREATVREVAGDTLVLLFKHRVHAEMLAGGPELLIEAVYEVLGPPAPDRAWQVRCELSGQAVSPGTASDQGPKPPVPPAQSRRDAPAAEPDWPTTAPPGGAAPAPRPDPSPAPATAPRKAGGRAAGNGRKAAAEPAEEPPDEPYEGFDPGDEPLDDVLDEQTVRQTSEEQALQLLRQTLGAEKIG